MAELLAYLARELVDDPDAVRVETEERDGALVLVLHVAADDVGKVIGRQGRIARALRTLVRASAVREGRRVLVEIADPTDVRVAALYDVHAMPWALEAVLAEVDAASTRSCFGGDYLAGPYPRETVALDPSLDAHVLRGNCERRWPRSGRLAARAGATWRWLQALPLTATVDGVLYCHATPDQQPADHDGDHARRGGQAHVRGRRGHRRDRAHASPVRPQRRRPAGRQRGLGRDAVRGRGRRLLDARRGRRAVVPAHARSTSSARSRRPARAPGRMRQEFVAENLLVAQDARRGDRGTGEPADVRVRDRPRRQAARPRRVVLRRAPEPRRALVEGRRALPRGGRRGVGRRVAPRARAAR